MGTWGYKAWENDTAADWLMEVLRRDPCAEAEKVISQPESDPAIYRAAAELMNRIGDPFFCTTDPEIYNEAVDGLERISQNQSWISTWEDPAAVKKEIQSTIDALRAKGDPSSEILGHDTVK